MKIVDPKWTKEAEEKAKANRNTHYERSDYEGTSNFSGGYINTQKENEIERNQLKIELLKNEIERLELDDDHEDDDK